MRKAFRVAGSILLAGLAACAAPSKPAPAAPPVPQAETPALAAFLAAARKMGITYATPAGYAEIPARDNVDQGYDYAVVSADRRTEMRFTLRGNDQVPEPLHDRKMAFVFFMTGISNLVRLGDDGRFAPPAPVPAAHYNADDAVLIGVHWFRTDMGKDAFGDGYVHCSAIFMYREGVGAAYTYILFKDQDALVSINEETMHAMRFAPR